MKLLLIGPDLAPPWTEGRKNLVRDLAPRLAARTPTRLLTTGPRAEATDEPCEGRRVAASTALQRLRALESSLSEDLATWRPDVVLHFPYGTTHGLRGWANLWSMGRIDRRCAEAGVRCLTLLYSFTRGPASRLERHVRELVLSRREGWKGAAITLGADLQRIAPVSPAPRARPVVLFMAGMSDSRPQALPYLLDERGLSDVIRAAGVLPADLASFLIAVPALGDPGFRAAVEAFSAQHAPVAAIEYRAAVDVPEVFVDADLYVFPYRVELGQFVPTSILEAMAAQVPVVVSDLSMLAPLARGGRTAAVYRGRDPQHLAAVLRDAFADRAQLAARAAAARAMVLQEWSIERTVDEVMALVERDPWPVIGDE